MSFSEYLNKLDPKDRAICAEGGTVCKVLFDGPNNVGKTSITRLAFNMAAESIPGIFRAFRNESTRGSPRCYLLHEPPNFKIGDLYPERSKQSLRAVLKRRMLPSEEVLPAFLLGRYFLEKLVAEKEVIVGGIRYDLDDIILRNLGTQFYEIPFGADVLHVSDRGGPSTVGFQVEMLRWLDQDVEAQANLDTLLQMHREGLLSACNLMVFILPTSKRTDDDITKRRESDKFEGTGFDEVGFYTSTAASLIHGHDLNGLEIMTHRTAYLENDPTGHGNLITLPVLCSTGLIASTYLFGDIVPGAWYPFYANMFEDRYTSMEPQRSSLFETEYKQLARGLTLRCGNVSLRMERCNPGYVSNIFELSISSNTPDMPVVR